MCGSMIKKGENIYICKCDLRVANKICGVDIGESNILKLMNNEETDLIEGFKINDGSTFSAHIYINKNAYDPKSGKEFGAEDLSELCKTKKLGPYNDFVGEKGRFYASSVYNTTKKKVIFKFK